MSFDENINPHETGEAKAELLFSHINLLKQICGLSETDPQIQILYNNGDGVQLKHICILKNQLGECHIEKCEIRNISGANPFVPKPDQEDAIPYLSLPRTPYKPDPDDNRPIIDSELYEIHPGTDWLKRDENTVNDQDLEITK